MSYRIFERSVTALAAAIPLLIIGALFVLPASAQEAKYDGSGALVRMSDSL